MAGITPPGLLPVVFSVKPSAWVEGGEIPAPAVFHLPCPAAIPAGGKNAPGPAGSAFISADTGSPFGNSAGERKIIQQECDSEKER